MKATIEDGRVLIEPDAASGTPGLMCSVETVAAWQRLLGLDTPGQALHAMLESTDPGVLDPDTGRNAWTSAWEQTEKDLLEDRNQTSASLMHAFSASGSLLADGRAETRRQLGLESNAKPVMLMSMARSIDPFDAVFADDAVAAHLSDASDRFDENVLSNITPKHK